MKNILFISCFMISILSCKNSNNVNNTDENIENDTTIEVTENTENLTDSIQVKNIQVGSESPDEKKKFHASYPSTLYDFINKEEEKFVQTYFEEFKENSKNVTDNSIGGIDFGQHFELVENNANYITFLIERYTSYGNNYDSKFFTHIYDLKNKDRIEFSNLFGNKENFNQFSSIAKEKAGKQLQKKLDEMDLTPADREQLWKNLQETLETGTAAKDENYHAFSWDKDGNLTVYFDKYQLASGDFGNIKISFSTNEYKHLLDAKYKDLLHFKAHDKEDDSTSPISAGTYTPRSDIDCGKEPCVAITFDDGPSVHTPKLLDILKENNVKATFFVLGKSAEIQKNTLLRTYKEGHQIGNHSWDHKDLKNLSKSSVEHQIYDTNNAVKEITGEAPHLMRPPYGSMNTTVKEVAGMPIILWNLDPLDWKDRDAKIVADRMSKANKNGIVLAHDIHKTTVNAIPEVIKALKEKGYHLVTIDELFAGQELKNGVKYSQRK